MVETLKNNFAAAATGSRALRNQAEEPSFKGDLMGAVLGLVAPPPAPMPAAETKPANNGLSAEANKSLQSLQAADHFQQVSPDKPMQKESPAEMRKDANTRVAQFKQVTQEMTAMAKNGSGPAAPVPRAAPRSNELAGKGSFVTALQPATSLSQPVGRGAKNNNVSAFAVSASPSPADAAVSEAFSRTMNHFPGGGRAPGADLGARSALTAMSLEGISGKMNVDLGQLSLLNKNALKTSAALNLRAEKGVAAPAPPVLQAAGIKPVLNGALA